jgi:hypothetical protein
MLLLNVAVIIIMPEMAVRSIVFITAENYKIIKLSLIKKLNS